MPTSRSTLEARPGLIAEIEEHLNSGSYSMRMAVVGALRVLPDGVGLAGLVRALGDVDERISVEAVYALCGRSDFGPAFDWTLSQGDLAVHVRLRALQALVAHRTDGGSRDLKAILAKTVRRSPGTEEARRADQVLAWMEQQSKLPVASAGEPDRSRDAAAADGSAVDRSRDAQAAREPAPEPERKRR